MGENLEAIISVTIMSNGTVKINSVEKSSGNVLFGPLCSEWPLIKQALYLLLRKRWREG